MASKKGHNISALKNGLAPILTSLLGVIIGLVITAVLLLCLGVSPLRAYSSMLAGALGGPAQLSATILKFTPLVFSALAVTLAYRAGIFNIGVEGQINIAGLCTTWVAVSFPVLPSFILVPLSLIAGILSAGVFALIPAYLKVKRGVNEVLTSIMLNYAGIYMVGVAVNSFLKMPNQAQPRSELLPTQAWIPKLFGGYIDASFFLMLLTAAVVYFILFHTTKGYEIRSIGLSRRASACGGIRVDRLLMLTMLFSGMLAGMAGSTSIMGAQHRLMSNFLVDYGYESIAVAILGGLNPAGILFTALLFAILKSGGNAMQIVVNVPVSVISIVYSVSILGVIILNRVMQSHGMKKGGA